ncbi:hypothetical protein H7J06_19600 [Mycobacterium hodleri]|uniref:hypothetical protein n=1 Tax=Mycolicibacterium hodleri TaxID=49897 RepID=UPI0021F263E5|nr:hypothetical protein [Mycolicibacterium hodleri]MCV7135190.1 hypothetical protein [Mycolicibacterium hodleri]
MAASTAQHAETALRDGLETTGPTVASLLATSPTLLSTTSVHQLAAVATAPAAIAPLIASDAVAGGTGAASAGSVGQVLAADVVSALPTLNPADAGAVVAAIEELIGQFVQSFLTTPNAILAAIQNVARGDVNGAFASLEGLVILPLINYGLSPYPQQAANAIARYLPSQLASAVTASPAIFLFQGARVIDLYTSARRSVVDAVQGVISSLGTLNPVAIAGAVASGLGNVIQTAVANTFGGNGAFAIVHDTIASLISAAFPDPASNTNTAVSNTVVARTALTTQAPSTTTSAQSATGITQSSPSVSAPAASIRATSTPTDDTSSAPGAPVPSATAAESKASATSEVTAQGDTADSATTDGSAPAHSTADEAKPDIRPAPTKTVDVTSGNKVEPKVTADASATPRSTSEKEPSNATATSPVKDSPTTPKSDTDASAAKTTSSSATP